MTRAEQILFYKKTQDSITKLEQCSYAKKYIDEFISKQKRFIDENPDYIFLLESLDDFAKHESLEISDKQVKYKKDLADYLKRIEVFHDNENFNSILFSVFYSSKSVFIGSLFLFIISASVIMIHLRSVNAIDLFKNVVVNSNLIVIFFQLFIDTIFPFVISIPTALAINIFPMILLGLIPCKKFFITQINRIKIVKEIKKYKAYNISHFFCFVLFSLFGSVSSFLAVRFLWLDEVTLDYSWVIEDFNRNKNDFLYFLSFHASFLVNVYFSAKVYSNDKNRGHLSKLTNRYHTEIGIFLLCVVLYIATIFFYVFNKTDSILTKAGFKDEKSQLYLIDNSSNMVNIADAKNLTKEGYYLYCGKLVWNAGEIYVFQPKDKEKFYKIPKDKITLLQRDDIYEQCE